jgi:hypothetical protein
MNDYSRFPDVKIICLKDGKTLGFYKCIIDKYPETTLYAALNSSMTITLNWHSAYVNMMLNDMERGTFSIAQWSEGVKGQYKYITLADEIGYFQNTKELKEHVLALLHLINLHCNTPEENKNAVKYIVYLYYTRPHLIPNEELIRVVAAITIARCGASYLNKDIFKSLIQNYSRNTTILAYDVSVFTELIKYMDEIGISNEEVFMDYCETMRLKCGVASFCLLDRVIDFIDYARNKYPDKILHVANILSNMSLRISLNINYLNITEACKQCKKMRELDGFEASNVPYEKCNVHYMI